MFDSLRSAFGAVYVEEKGGIITIGGFPTAAFFKDVNSIWGSVKAISFMFTVIKSHRVSFDVFFSVDVLYMINQIVQYKKRKSSSYRLNKAMELLRTETWLRTLDEKHADIIDYNQLKNLHHELFPHQLNALKEYNYKVPRMQLNGFLLAADVGTGKSIMSLAISECVHSEVTILMSPKSILDKVWVDSVREEFGEDVSMYSVTLHGDMQPGYKFYILNYEAIAKLIPLIPYFSKHKTTVVIDESHNFNDPTSNRSIVLAKFCKKINAQNIIFASGTAVKAMGYEMITLLRCIDPLFNQDVEDRFRKIYGISAKRAVDILRHRIDMVGHKIPKSVVMKIPPPIVKKLLVKMPGSEVYLVENIKQEMAKYLRDRIGFYTDNMKQYIRTYEECLKAHRNTLKTSQEKKDFDKYVSYIETIRKYYDPKAHKEIVKFCNDYEKRKIIPSLVPEMKNKFREAKSVVKYVQLKVLGEALGNVLAKRREECHVKMMDHIDFKGIIENADKKVLMFTDFVQVIEYLDAKFKKMGYDARFIYGETNKDVGKIIDIFKSDPNVNPLAATYKSLSAGVTLVNCSVVMLLNMPFRQYIVEQAVHRIFRIGQDAQTYVIEVTLDTGTHLNISTRSEDILNWSKEQVEAIMGKNIPTDEALGIIQHLNLNPETRIDRVLKRFAKWLS
jgi:SNF2 family DNA or RNA helicase